MERTSTSRSKDKGENKTKSPETAANVVQTMFGGEGDPKRINLEKNVFQSSTLSNIFGLKRQKTVAVASVDSRPANIEKCALHAVTFIQFSQLNLNFLSFLCNKQG